LAMNDENSSEVDPIIEEVEFELRNIKVAENRIGSLQRTRRLVTMCAGCNERNDNHNGV
jgi:hypothetical protein